MFLDPKETMRLLGYNDDAKLLVIHGDDAGMCHSANAATAAALQRGIVTCASAMAPCPWFLHFVDWAKAHPEADVGLHLTLTSEWEHYRWRPLSPPDRVPSLLDEDGFLWRTTKDIFDHAVLSEMEIEARAQIEYALTCGLNPSHIDSHMGVFSVPGGLELFVRLGEEYGILPRLLPRGPEDLARLEQTLWAERAEREERAAGDPSSSRRRRIPVAYSIRLAPKAPTVEAMRDALRETVCSLAPGIWGLTLHLNGDDDEIRAVTPMWEQRFREFTLFTSDEAKSILDEAGVVLVDYQRLAGVWRQEG